MTPAYALDPILPWLKPGWVIWESAYGEGGLARALSAAGYPIICTDIAEGKDFFIYQPGKFDCQLTNPPWSLKLRWLERSYRLDKPFALLLPVEVLGVGTAQRLFERYGVEVILLDRRIDYQTVNTSFAKSSAWFPSCWITHGLNIGSQLTFGKITKRPDSQLSLFAQMEAA